LTDESPSHVEDSDKTILDAVIRETFEETGLHIGEIVGEISPFEYSFEKVVEGVSPTTVMEKSIQLNFVVKVSPGSFTHHLQVKLNAEEHQNFAWVSQDDLESYDTTEEMRAVIANALVWAGENIEKLQSDLVTEDGEERKGRHDHVV
jgi:8-oxo-dGTP pyrophosphatase MutT (NUDIX family)